MHIIKLAIYTEDIIDQSRCTWYPSLTVTAVALPIKGLATSVEDIID